MSATLIKPGSFCLQIANYLVFSLFKTRLSEKSIIFAFPFLLPTLFIKTFGDMNKRYRKD